MGPFDSFKNTFIKALNHFFIRLFCNTQTFSYCFRYCQGSFCSYTCLNGHLFSIRKGLCQNFTISVKHPIILLGRNICFVYFMTVYFVFIPLHIIWAITVFLKYISHPARVILCLHRMISPAVSIGLKMLDRITVLYRAIFITVFFLSDPDQWFCGHCLWFFPVFRIGMECKKISPHLRQLCQNRIIIILIPPIRSLRKVMKRMDSSLLKNWYFSDIYLPIPYVNSTILFRYGIPMKIKSDSQQLQKMIRCVKYRNLRISGKYDRILSGT